MTTTRKTFELEEIRAQLSRNTGRTYWRSLEEAASSPAVESYLETNYPTQFSLLSDPVERRSFLQIMGASLALAGLGSCTRQPEEKILPFASKPESLIPGQPRYFASAMPLAGSGIGILAESHMGRPTKIEGNPQHPSSLGATDSITQASVLSLYDPDRSQTVLHNGRISTRADYLTELRSVLDSGRARRGAGLRVLSTTISSPTLAAQREQFLREFPRASWVQYEPVNRDNARAGALLAFGEDASLRYDFSKADVVLSLDSDFLAQGPSHVADTRGFSQKRRGRKGVEGMNRLYSVESVPGLTGAMADHRLALRSQSIEALALEMAQALDVPQVKDSQSVGGEHSEWVRIVARDLQRNGQTALVLAGDAQPPIVHALALAMNVHLGSYGQCLISTEPIEPVPSAQLSGLRQLCADLEAGQVDALFVLNGNPIYDTPADLGFAKHFNRVAFRAHLGLYADETSEQCQWHVPAAHFLESWSDVRAHDGTHSIIQPLISPLYGGLSAHEFVSGLLGESQSKAYDIVREHWQTQIAGADSQSFEREWRRALHDGLREGTSAAPIDLKLDAKLNVSEISIDAGGGFELNLRPDPHVWDGRFANNGWLQELPKPATRLTWDNALLIAPADAAGLEVENGQVVKLRGNGTELQVPVWIVPGHATGALTLHLGYGRTRAGHVGNGAGVNAYPLQSKDSLWRVNSVQVEPTGAKRTLACTQDHNGMEALEHRDIVRVEDLERFREGHVGAPAHLTAALATATEAPHASSGSESDQTQHASPSHASKSLYDPSEFSYEDQNAWGMVIDLNACTGCSACTIACQAENNIPVVGRTEVSRGREMHWIRVDRYFTGSVDEPETVHQPVPCMQCENAPCEVVCPVGATVHSQEGLNDMVYNRCVGTRYCANNCPYKVRRFNFFSYADFDTESLKLLRNPDVTVRSRGVMEKCSYCTQRISQTRIQAKREGREIVDGELQTACQQVCPAQAITFGDTNDAESAVALAKAEPHNYTLLDHELNTRPRTSYLARLRNPNPELEI